LYTKGVVSGAYSRIVFGKLSATDGMTARARQRRILRNMYEISRNMPPGTADKACYRIRGYIAGRKYFISVLTFRSSSNDATSNCGNSTGKQVACNRIG
jgi:hypothetical protein